MPPTQHVRTDATSSTDPSAADADVDAQVRLALATWPQIDPDVEGIVTRIAKAARYLDHAARASLARVGLTKEEFKVLLRAARRRALARIALPRTAASRPAP